MRTCQEDGTWSGSAAFCVPMVALGARCTVDAQCGDDAWCTTDTVTELRRCSPRVFAETAHAMDFVFVPAGTFVQGTPGATNEERPYLSGLSHNYWVSKTEVTQAQWTALSGGTNPSCFQSTTGTSCASGNANVHGPVEQVDFYSSLAYANALSASEGLDACYVFSGCTGTDWWQDGGQNGCTGVSFAGLDCTGYRLLTEAEWERAARAATSSTYFWGEDTTLSVVGLYAWYNSNAGSRSNPVGTKTPNAWGIHDVSGNVSEWVWDWVHTGANYQAYPNESTVDYVGAASGTQRGIRGAGWQSASGLLRSARRLYASVSASRTNQLGIRLARSVPTGSPGTTGCGLLPAPVGGQVVIPSTFTGSTATYSCSPAGTLTGSATRVCQAGGAWGGTAPTCVFPGCGVPPGVANGSFVATGQETDDTATYECDYGYDQEVRAGGAGLTCQTDGSWFNSTAGTGTPPACSPLLCPAPAAPIDGQVDYTSLDHDSSALHSCNAGWALVGEELQTCDGELGLWYDDTPVCLRDCGSLSAPTDGSIDVSSTLEGATADYSCDAGYTLSGSAVRTCQDTGAWTGTAATCAPVDCGAPEKIVSGSRILSGTEFGDTATYACDAGFTLEGSSSATCTAGGTWSTPTPICAAEAGALCEEDFQCPTGFWCPVADGLPADHRRCSPVVEERGAMTVRSFWIPSGSYSQGSPTGELGRSNNEIQHLTVLSRPLWVMEHPVPQSLFESLTRATPSRFAGLATCDADPLNPGRCPVERVGFFDAIAMANALSAAEGLEECYNIDETSCTGTPNTGCGVGINSCTSGTWTCTKWDDAGPDCTGWRLPSEAEWEHTARAGTTRATWLGNLSGSLASVLACPPTTTPAQTSLDPIALWCRVSGSSVGALGARAGNPWGPRDMLGHVAEWTRDAFDVYTTDTALDPWPSSRSADRAVRGGAWSFNAAAARAASRGSVALNLRSSSIGLRLVRTVPAAPDSTCTVLGVPANGSLSYSDGLSRASVATTACSAGYAVSGNPERVCMHSGEWSGTAAVCNLDLQALGETCAITAQCPAGSWCPDVAAPARRVCSPQPSPGGFTMTFLYAPAGTFNMGSPFAELGRATDARENQVTVTHSDGFFMGRNEVTQQQWMALMNNQNPTAGTTSGFPTAPVTNVSWWSAADFANRLSTANGLTACYNFSSLTCTGSAPLGTLDCGTGSLPVTPSAGGALACTGYRLPTEAEWEYVARAGTFTATWAGNLTTTGCSGSDTLLDPLAYYCGNSLNPTFGTRHARPVGSKAANPWGFFDMLGNINEHVWDTYTMNMPGGTDPATVGTGPRSARGGSFSSNAEAVRAASRLSVAPSSPIGTLGFRLARSTP
jgi:formylglycine-generating enzyme required for sulfatase activity